jgi:hypothetical protein
VCQASFSDLDFKMDLPQPFLGAITPESNTPGRVFLEEKECIKREGHSVDPQILGSVRTNSVAQDLETGPRRHQPGPILA